MKFGDLAILNGSHHTHTFQKGLSTTFSKKKQKEFNNYKNDYDFSSLLEYFNLIISEKLISKNNGIPSDHFVRTVAEDPSKFGLLYADTEFPLGIAPS